MPTYIRVKDLPNSASSLNADDYIMLSGSVGGARKIEKADFLSTVADEFNAAPSTYKLATLDASNKVNSSQWPASAFSYQGTWAASSNTPTLANGSGTAGYTYYASDSGSVNFGAGAISFTAGDAVVYDGSIWQKVPDVANILDGKGTVDEGKTTLQIPNVGTAANEVPVNGMLNSGAWVDWDSHYSEGTWTPTLKLGGSAVSHASQSAVFTKIGNTVNYSGMVILSNLDSLTGTVTIEGLPYTAKNTSAGQSAVTVGYAVNMASLTSVPTGFVGNNESKIYLYHFGSTGAVDLSNTNLTATSQIRFSGTYQIA